MKIALGLLSLLSTVLLVQGSALSADQHWAMFKAKYGRQFSDIESRKDAFLAVKAAVDKHNAEAAEGLHTYTQEVYAHSIMTEEEMVAMKGRLAQNGPREVAIENLHVNDNAVTAPVSLDLRTNKCTPKVYNQGGCGSCWTFAATTPIDYQNCINKKLAGAVSFSEQEFVDCVNGGGGCGGGLEYVGWDYLIKNKMGVMTLADYPYVAKNQVCKYNASKPLAKLSGYKKISPKSVADMKQALATYGIIAVAVQANGDFSNYKGGILSSNNCGTQLDHSVTCVGYGTDAATGQNFWIVRNSWGPTWGEGGYIRMKMGINQCGVEDDTSYPIVAV